jgi:peroxiredoxin Q/BCP
VIGVSRDTQETSDRFQKSLDLPYPLVGDPDGVITRAYKVRWPLVSLARRATFVIDAQRVIRMAFHSELDPEAHVTRVCAFVPGRG